MVILFRPNSLAVKNFTALPVRLTVVLAVLPILSRDVATLRPVAPVVAMASALIWIPLSWCLLRGSPCPVLGAVGFGGTCLYGLLSLLDVTENSPSAIFSVRIGNIAWISPSSNWWTIPIYTLVSSPHVLESPLRPKREIYYPPRYRHLAG